MQKIELLAPAGNFSAVVAAIQAGCNAVYLSGKDFGARSFAENFDENSLKEATIYAHKHYVKVYVTINTLIFDDEFEKLDNYLQFLSSINIDAVIVQDIGVIKYIKTNYKHIDVHASTQMNIFNLEGVKNLKKLGVSRVVVAREMPIDEIKELTNIMEVEVFVHGALCFSSSGNCLMSSSIGGRSGNRGKCAQPCRKKYNLVKDGIVISESKSYLSMKDLMTINDISKLIEIGVSSFKIEGRMKKAEYVYTVTKNYRKAIDKTIKNQKFVLDADDEKRMRVTFNREFTKGYILNENNDLLTNINYVNHQGINIGKIVNCSKNFVEIHLIENVCLHDGLRVKSKEEQGIYVTSLEIKGVKVKKAFKGDNVKIYFNNKCKIGDIVIKTSDDELELEIKDILQKENVKYPLKMRLNAFIGKNIMLEINDHLNNKVSVTGEILNYANNYIGDERIESQLAKLTQTPYYLDKLVINSDYSCFISVSMLNNLRRMAILELQEKLLKVKPSNLNYLLSNCNNKIDNTKLFVDCIVNSKEQEEICRRYANLNIYRNNIEYGSRIEENKGIFIHNLGHIKEDINNADYIISPYFNIFNRYSLEAIEDFGIKNCYLSLEIDYESMIKLKLSDFNLNVGVFIYGAFDLMVSKHCVIGKYSGSHNKHCGECINHKYYLKDEYSNYYPLQCDSNLCIMQILSSKKINLISNINNLKRIGVKRFMLNFTDETEEEIANILDRLYNYKDMVKSELDYKAFFNKKVQ